MKDRRLNQNSIWTPQARTTIIIGFFLRLLMFVIILYVTSSFWDIFYIEDDKKYEELAAIYRANASSVFDMELFDILTKGYAAHFWPFVMCTITKFTGYLYAGRLLNVCLSTVCIAVIYNLCYEVSDNQKTALTAARLYAFLPFPILVSCFPIKDIFIMLGTMYAFYIFVRVQRGRKVPIWQFVLLAVLLVCIYFSRGAVSELLLLIFLVYFMQRLLQNRKYIGALVLFGVAAVVIVAFRSAIFSSFSEKLEGGLHYEADAAAGLNVIRVTGVADLYKLPLAYAFAMLQPMQLNLAVLQADTRPWTLVMSYTNMTMYPVAMGAWFYMFSKKHNLFFWLSGFVMFSAVLMLTMGVSRHYLFLFPLHLINYALYMEETHENFKNRRTMVILGSFVLLVAVFGYTLIKVF